MPTQARGARRVAALLKAAVLEFSESGYEGATMSAIAARAGSQIGSLYQFFPNKEAIARALRTGHVEDVDRMVRGLSAEADGWSVEQFVDRFVGMMIGFVNNHPAFLPLLDAPSSTEPTGARHELRRTLGAVLVAQRPGMTPARADRCATVVLRVNKALMSEYARSGPEDRRWIAQEYRRVLRGYLGPVLGGRQIPPEARRAGRSGGKQRGTPV